MSMTDPIADLLTRIRNGQRAGKPRRCARLLEARRLAIVKVLKDEGYIGRLLPCDADGGKPTPDACDLQVLRAAGRSSTASSASSRPGLRIYRGQGRAAEDARAAWAS